MPRNMSQEARLRKYKYEAQYALDHTTQFKLKLNNKTDADIIAYLTSLPNKQGALKVIIRDRMTAEGFVYTPEEEPDEQHEEH